MCHLDTLPKGHHAIIELVEQRTSPDPISARLEELGFVPGETVEVIAVGPVNADPIAVSLGSSRFALRKGEAARIALKEAF
ncbi:FeoA family protein [Swingsia samuiensis]|uniref:Ferrous iron transport protein A n=1 Tax=Swingsia samuiensis TaxID=1293412 RepID=A0A4Y6UGL1_9PROT|nr:FeoA family protein [Swingsia samuiensis]QDH16699.1 ferrous iron transport protein A [Swingsia samuiensis]